MNYVLGKSDSTILASRRHLIRIPDTNTDVLLYHSTPARWGPG